MSNPTKNASTAEQSFLNIGFDTLGKINEERQEISSVLSDLESLSSKTSKAKIEKLRKELFSFEPTITMIGQIKSGKTTLVNAMVQQPDLLPADVNPWTSVVTSLHLNNERPADAPKATFQLFGKNEWDHLVRNGGRIGELSQRAGAEDEATKVSQQVAAMREKTKKRLGRTFEMLLGQKHSFDHFDSELIKRYVCLGDDIQGEEDDGQGQFADLTQSADLYLDANAIPIPLCIRDTPGVNDTFMMREQVTIRAIRDSQLCVLVLSASQALTSTDLGLIRLISNVKTRELLIFVNRIDELSDPENQLGDIQNAIRETLKAHNGPEDAEIIFGSAYWANTVLESDVDNMDEDSAETLNKCGDMAIARGAQFANLEDLVWQLSGLPHLFTSLAERIRQGTAAAAMNTVRTKARNYVAALAASENLTSMRLEGSALEIMEPQTIQAKMAKMKEAAVATLDEGLDTVFKQYYTRIDQSNTRFVDRALESLIQHLEKHGDEVVWRYNPDGLRILLRSGYQLMRTRYAKVCNDHYKKIAKEITTFYREAMSVDVENFSITSPTSPEVPAPAIIGQTIALDLQTNWWKGWWQRKKGYRAYSKSFHELISAETQSIVDVLKGSQTDQLRGNAHQRLVEFMDEQTTILQDVAAKAKISVNDLNQLFGITAQQERQELIELMMEELKVKETEPLIEGEAA